MSSIEIPLTRGKFAIIDRDDMEFVMRHNWRYHCDNRKGNKGEYANTGVPKRGLLQMHSYIMNCPKGMRVDHINGNGLDNRRENLRIYTRAQNSRNKKRHYSKKSSQFKGSYKNGNRWMAMITHEKVKYWLGTFATEIEAARAYNKKAKELHGEFANYNKSLEPRPVRLGVSWK